MRSFDIRGCAVSELGAALLTDGSDTESELAFTRFSGALISAQTFKSRANNVDDASVDKPALDVASDDEPSRVSGWYGLELPVPIAVIVIVIDDNNHDPVSTPRPSAIRRQIWRLFDAGSECKCDFRFLPLFSSPKSSIQYLSPFLSVKGWPPADRMLGVILRG